MPKFTRTVVFCVCMLLSIVLPLFLLIVPRDRSPQNCHNFGNFSNSPHKTDCDGSFCFAACITEFRDNKINVVKFGGRLCQYYENFLFPTCKHGSNIYNLGCQVRLVRYRGFLNKEVEQKLYMCCCDSRSNDCTQQYYTEFSDRHCSNYLT